MLATLERDLKLSESKIVTCEYSVEMLGGQCVPKPIQLMYESNLDRAYSTNQSRTRCGFSILQ